MSDVAQTKVMALRTELISENPAQNALASSQRSRGHRQNLLWIMLPGEYLPIQVPSRCCETRIAPITANEHPAAIQRGPRF